MAGLTRRTLLGALSLATAAAATGCGERGAGGSAPPRALSFKGIDITGADYANALSLPDARGQVRDLKEFQGKVVVVFFGFTQCPDVCPTTLAELAEVRRRLGAQGERVQGIFVTLDPPRDTPELLQAYMGSFDPSFIALRGTPEQTAAVAKTFKVFYARVPGKTEGSYTIDHTAGAYLFDAQGRIRVFTRHGTGAEALQHDLKQLLDAG
jgi:protein SCO1/2